jgi:demethoxyubiquinone hydroxylase (CLK1/Coq7/Cat5 family)
VWLYQDELLGRIAFMKHVKKVVSVFNQLKSTCGVFWDVTPCDVRTDLSEELSASFIRVTKIGELGTTPAVTSTLRKIPSELIAACVG